VLPTDNVIEE